MKKVIIVLIVAAGITAGGKYYWDVTRALPAGEDMKPTFKEVERGQVQLKVSTTGRVVANLDVEIKCKASGEVRKLPYDISDEVKKGDLLIELDPEDEERKVTQASISLSASEARHAQARQNLLIAEENISSEKKRAEAALVSARARLDEAMSKLDQTLERKDLVLEKKRAETSLVVAEAHAKDTRAKAARTRQLLAAKLASEEEFETAETSAIRAESDLELAKLKIEQLELEKLTLAEELETAKRSVTIAESELNLARIRLEEIGTKEKTLAIKKDDVKLAKSAVELDRLALIDARQRLKDTRVAAPMDGVVVAREVQIGQIISSAISNVGGGTTVLTLSDMSELFVLASVDESDISKVAVGQKVVITTDAYPDKEFEGEVVRIAIRGENVSNIITFEVRIRVRGEEKNLLKPEMTTNVDIISAEKDNVLLVPAQALKRDGGDWIVEIYKNDETTQERAIEIGISDGVKTEVVDGMIDGEKVVLKDGEAQSRWRNSRKSKTSKRGSRNIMKAVH